MSPIPRLVSVCSSMKVKVTYANKRRRAHVEEASSFGARKDCVLRSEMAYRMVKQSRRVALADQTEERAIVQERPAKRVKRSDEGQATEGEEGML